MDLETIKKKKLEELQQKYEQDMQEQLELQKQVEFLENMVKPQLTREALSRYGNLKAAHPEKSIQVIALLAQSIQQGQIQEKITDEQLKTFLQKIQPEKKEFKIKRR